jgi:hypothetical protein
MKFFAYCALIASTNAALGDDCYYDASICATDGLFCATWEDSQYGDMASCENCDDGVGQMITDSFGDLVEYVCPPESYPVEEEPEEEEVVEEEEEVVEEAPPAAPTTEEEGSSKLVASAIALVATVSMMA